MDETKRTHIVMARFNEAELERLDALRDLFSMSRAKFIRTRSLGDSLPQMAVVPELNRQAWVELSRAASNLNQIAHHLNLTELKGKRVVNINEINKALIDFRNKLIGASDYFEEDVEEEEEEQEEDEEE